MSARLIIILISALSVFSAYAQSTVSGIVRESGEDGSVVYPANVVIKRTSGKMMKFGKVKPDGTFSLVLPDVTDSLFIEVTALGYDMFRQPLRGGDEHVDVRMQHGAVKLKEVTVKAARIREQGDTITYSVGGFAQKQDRSIGDVLRRMPGIEVKESGSIKYQGEDINRFYIEGSDLMGSKYGVAVNGISHDDVGAVEVMENHQPLQVLSGISFSDRAALNLKLKKKAKATWSAHGNAGGGYMFSPGTALWEGSLFTMAVMPGFQNLTTFMANNTGREIADQLTDLFDEGAHTGLSRYINVSLPSVPSLRRNRTTFNRSCVVSTNNLWKLPRGEVKAQVDYSFGRNESDAENAATYFLPEGDRVVTEHISGARHTHKLSGKFIYEANEKTFFLNNTLRTDVKWDDVALRIMGSLNNTQNASMPDYQVRNQLKLIKRFKSNRLITFESRNEWESMPQRLIVLPSEGAEIRQHVTSHSFNTKESAAFTFLLGPVSVGVEAGLTGTVRAMSSEISRIPQSIPGITDNAINTGDFTVYARPQFEYWYKKINVRISAPVSFATYTFDHQFANRSELYFSPTLDFDWKLGSKIEFNINGGAGRAPMSLGTIYPGVIMTDYRTFHSGTDRFYNTNSQRMGMSLKYKYVRYGLFSNMFASHTWNSVPYTMHQLMYDDYVVYSYSAARARSRNFNVGANVGKGIDIISGSANLSGSYSRGVSALVAENVPVHSVSTSWGVGFSANGRAARWLSLEYYLRYSASRISMNGIDESWLGSVTHTGLIDIIPHDKWEWHISADYYSNDITADTHKNLMLMDSKLSYRMNRRVELAASVTNIFDRRAYSYKVYNSVSSYESQRRLRGREILLTVTIYK
ncbi:MAG: TonB-dependent receptor [Muribaculaceae bacterium]|nr:TonB-dependent receptor [Muribaculaceae bacterium]